MAEKTLITSANFASIVPGSEIKSLQIAPSYKASVSASISTITTDTGAMPTIDSGQTTRDGTLLLKGSVDAGSLVKIFDGSTFMGVATVDNSSWSFTTPILSDGTHNLIAQAIDNSGNIQITSTTTILIDKAIELGPNQLLSHSSPSGNLDSTGIVGTTQKLIGLGDGALIFKAADSSKFGNAALAFSDGNASTQDLLLADASTGSLSLINRSFGSATTSSNQDVTFTGVSTNGRYVIFASSAVTSFGNNAAFTDNNSSISGTSDLFLYDRITSTVSLATWSGTSTNSSSRNSSFIGLTSDNQYLIYRSDYAEKISNFTRSVTSDGTASSDLLAYNLSNGTTSLLTHSAASGNSQTFGAAAGNTVILSNDGKYVLFTANNASNYGNNNISFTDSNPNSADLFAVRLSDGQVSLLSSTTGDTNTSAAAAVTLLGQSSSGAYAVFSAADATKFGFTDQGTAVTDLFSVNIATGLIRLLNHPPETLTAAVNAIPTFIKVVGDYAYFTVKDSTILGASSDGDSSKQDLYRANLATGAVSLLSFTPINSNASMNGSYISDSLVVSSDNRFVAFSYSVPESTSTGFTFEYPGGDAVFVVDTYTGSIKLVNHNDQLLQNKTSWALSGWAKAKTFADNNHELIFDTLISRHLADFSNTADNQYNSIMSFNLASGSINRLTHDATPGNRYQSSTSTYRGISSDGQIIFFTANDATKFGNNGSAFTDSATTATDLFAVNVKTGLIDLISGDNGISLGTSITFEGISESGQVFYRAANVNNLKSGIGIISDQNTSGSDLIASRMSLLDLDTAGDSAGGSDGTSTDNITTARTYTIRGRVLPNQQVRLLDNGTQIPSGEATANSQGMVSWTLSNVSLGLHAYSMVDVNQNIPIAIGGRLGSSDLAVVVKSDLPVAFAQAIQNGSGWSSIPDSPWISDRCQEVQTLLDNLPGISDGIKDNETLFEQTGTLYADSIEKMGAKSYYFTIDSLWKLDTFGNTTVLDRTGTLYDDLFEIITPSEYSDWRSDKLTHYNRIDNSAYSSLRYGSSYIEQDKVLDSTGLTVMKIDSLSSFTQTTTAAGKTITLDGDILIDLSAFSGTGSFDLIKAGSILSANTGGLLFDRANFIQNPSSQSALPSLGLFDTNNDGLNDVLRLSIL